jgi:uroporphyrinogen III methyltransferase/synthase
VTARLDQIAEKAEEAGIRPPAVTIVGNVVHLRESLRWFDTKPLFGKRVLVTRSREQASSLSARLRELGAESVEFPTIVTAPPDDCRPLDRALDELGDYDWIVFTSVNGVKYFMKRLWSTGRDARTLSKSKLAAIGPITAAELEAYGLLADFMPETYVAEAIAEGIPAAAGERVLLPRADLARPALAQELEQKGCTVDEVTAYRTLPYEPSADELRALLDRQIDIATFASSSTVRNFVAVLQDKLEEDWRSALSGATVACIGPITAQTAREMGLESDVVAHEHTIEGLVEAILAFEGTRTLRAE